MKLKKQVFHILANDGSKISVEGLCSSLFGIHKIERGGYNITWLNVGCNVYHADSLSEARKLVAKLETSVAWPSIGWGLTANISNEFREELRELLTKWHNEERYQS